MIEGASLPIRSVGPDLGQHTREVLHSVLGLGETRLEHPHDPDWTRVPTPRADLRDVHLRSRPRLTRRCCPPNARSRSPGNCGAGAPALEIGSMAQADLVPPLSAIDVITALTPDELDGAGSGSRRAPRRSRRRLDEACNTASRLQIPTTKPASGAARRLASRRCRTQSGSRESAEPSSCASPRRSPAVEGLTDPERVIGIAADPRTDEADDIVVCDTIGARPYQARSPTSSWQSGSNTRRRIVFHGHDTWGQA